MVNEMLPDLLADSCVYFNGQRLTEDRHFYDHILHDVPIQVYLASEHCDIGYIKQFCDRYVHIADSRYERNRFTFISRPGY
jgi:hypothetical protein